jgi:hypothetical protein
MPVETNYRHIRTVGIATNSGKTEAKQRPIELLHEAVPLAGELSLYVAGEPFDRTLWSIMGHLQRTLDPVEEKKVTD